jgi:hypothetical protein
LRSTASLRHAMAIGVQAPDGAVRSDRHDCKVKVEHVFADPAME